MKNNNKSRLANFLIAFIAIACQLNLTASENGRTFDSLTVIVNQYDNLSPFNAKVTLEQIDAPFDVFTKYSDSIGYAVFDSLSEGYYDITIEKPGYNTEFFPSYLIDENKTLNVSLCQNKYPARNLSVDTLTSKAKWEKARIEALAIEDFEDELFPPEGWEVQQTDTVNYPETWHRVTGQFNPSWYIPPQKEDGTYTWYAGNYEFTTGVASQHQDFLITPYFDLRISDSLNLVVESFSYKSGVWGSGISIEYCFASSDNWLYLCPIVTPYPLWENSTLNLSFLSGTVNGNDSVKFRFAGTGALSDYYECAALDNIGVIGAISNAASYKVFLDDEFIAETPADINEFNFECLNYGQEYTAGVKAVYPCGVSEMEEFTFTSTFTYPPREIGNNYTYGTKNLQLKWLAPENCNSGEVAEGLVHFNIYRNKEFVASRTYSGQGLNDTIFFNENNLDPGDYSFNVSAVYNLTPYGFPGDTTESMMTPDDSVHIVWGKQLPFMEEWDEGFSHNEWTKTSDNWQIDNSTGQNEPSASFLGNPSIDTVYQLPLVSTYFVADSLTEGELYLDFDIKLDDNITTGTELLSVEVRSAMGQWEGVASFANNGSFDFTTYHINIRQMAMTEQFQIRFTASGQNSSDIAAWHIDNINIYRKCEAPQNLNGEYAWKGNDEFGAEISWSRPAIPGLAEWIQWCYPGEGQEIDMGFSMPFTIAARWDAGMLSDYDGKSLTKVKIFIANSNFSQLNFFIGSGPNAQNILTTKIVDPDELNINDYNIIELDEVIIINANTELWVGYTIYPNSYDIMAAGCDNGPANVGYGNKIKISGHPNWQDFSDFTTNPDINWYIEALVEDPENQQITIATSGQNNRALDGFNIYRSISGDDYQFLTSVPIDMGYVDYSYFDTDVDLQQEYKYKVRANYQGEYDFCESESAMNIEGDEDFVSVLITAFHQQKNQDRVLVYPNPANSRIYVNSKENINTLSIYNSSGLLIHNSANLKETKLIINSNNYKPGLYFVLIKTKDNIFVNKIIVTH